jgi:hypothetical protein
MRRHVVAITVAIINMVVIGTAAFTRSQATDPFAFYKDYLGVLAKATSIEPLLPYFTKELAGAMRKAPKDQQANYVKMNKRVLTDLKATRQTVTGDKAELQMTAKDESGQPMTGTASLVKEGGAWKIDDFTWVGPPPKP